VTYRYGVPARLGAAAMALGLVALLMPFGSIFVLGAIIATGQARRKQARAVAR